MNNFLSIIVIKKLKFPSKLKDLTYEKCIHNDMHLFNNQNSPYCRFGIIKTYNCSA